MSQRDSGYERKERDLYETPAWVTEALLPHLPASLPSVLVITNPPYELAREFIEKSLTIADHVAMLLRTDYDHAKSRAHLFGNCPSFAKKVVLTKRIKWFEYSTAQPSFNHAWFIWDSCHNGPPTLAYAPLHLHEEEAQT